MGACSVGHLNTLATFYFFTTCYDYPGVEAGGEIGIFNFSTVFGGFR